MNYLASECWELLPGLSVIRPPSYIVWVKQKVWHLLLKSGWAKVISLTSALARFGFFINLDIKSGRKRYFDHGKHITSDQGLCASEISGCHCYMLGLYTNDFGSCWCIDYPVIWKDPSKLLGLVFGLVALRIVNVYALGIVSSIACEFMALWQPWAHFRQPLAQG